SSRARFARARRHRGSTREARRSYAWPSWSAGSTPPSSAGSGWLSRETTESELCASPSSVPCAWARRRHPACPRPRRHGTKGCPSPPSCGKWSDWPAGRGARQGGRAESCLKSSWRNSWPTSAELRSRLGGDVRQQLGGGVVVGVPRLVEVDDASRRAAVHAHGATRDRAAARRRDGHYASCA